MASLDSLPSDVHFSIFSNLTLPFVTCDFQATPHSHIELKQTEKVNHLKWSDKPLSNHPFLALAAQSKSLRASVESYCHHLLRKRSKVLIRQPKHDADWSTAIALAASKHKNLDFRSYRQQYLKAIFHKCQFCEKATPRRAVFNTHMYCCRVCDNKEFGPKIVGGFY